MNDNNTLGSYFPNQTQQNYLPSSGVELYKATFDTIFAINLVHRFTNLGNWAQIDPNMVRTIAQFSLPCSVIAQEVWDNYSSQYSREGSQTQTGPFKAYPPKRTA